MATKIGWTDDTWNPTHGCAYISEACSPHQDEGAGCYAADLSIGRWTDEDWTFENLEENVKLQEHKLADVANFPAESTDPWLDESPEDGDRHPHRTFVNSMSDLFLPERAIPDEYVHRVFDWMEDMPHRVFQILTKHGAEGYGDGPRMPTWDRWPANVWMGVSVETAKRSYRIDRLRETDADVKFISFEPLVGSVGELDLSGIDWAIIGGESGEGYREMDHEWAYDILQQCREQDVAYFFKQDSDERHEQRPYLYYPEEMDERRRLREMPAPHPSVLEAIERIEPDRQNATLEKYA